MIGTHAHASAQTSGLVKAALIAGGVFLLWRTARGLRNLGWTAFGLGMAAYWTGFWPF